MIIDFEYPNSNAHIEFPEFYVSIYFSRILDKTHLTIFNQICFIKNSCIFV